jgi:hypothetical protein
MAAATKTVDIYDVFVALWDAAPICPAAKQFGANPFDEKTARDQISEGYIDYIFGRGLKTFFGVVDEQGFPAPIGYDHIYGKGTFDRVTAHLRASLT